MFRSAHSPLGTLLVFLFLAPFIEGCMSTQHVPFNNTVELDRITGVTTRAGWEIPFVQPGASITNDTLYALGGQGQLILPTESITLVSKRKFSAARTAGLIGGFAVAIAAIAAIAGANAFGNWQPYPVGY